MINKINMTIAISNNTLETYYLKQLNQILNKLKITIIVIVILYSVYLYYRLKQLYNYYF